jgi:hypothetical protein
LAVVVVLATLAGVVVLATLAGAAARVRDDGAAVETRGPGLATDADERSVPVSALAAATPPAITTPAPRANASAPTRPTYEVVV